MSQLQRGIFVILDRFLVYRRMFFYHIANASLKVEYVIVIDSRRCLVVKIRVAWERTLVIHTTTMDLEARRAYGLLRIGPCGRLTITTGRVLDLRKIDLWVLLIASAAF